MPLPSAPSPDTPVCHPATAPRSSGPKALGNAVVVPAALISTPVLIGNGTAQHPDGGLLFGNGFSYDATTCTIGSNNNGRCGPDVNPSGAQSV